MTTTTEDFPSFDDCAQVIPMFDGTSEEVGQITWKALAQMMLEDRREAKAVEQGLRDRIDFLTETLNSTCGCV